MKPRNAWNPEVTEDMIIDACERRLSSLDNPGFCLACGFEQDGCEPDAREYVCEACGETEVFGCEELMMEIA